MKTLMAVGALIAAWPLHAEYGYHAVLIAQKAKFPLVAAEDGDMRTGAQNQENRLDFESKAPVTDEWTTHSFSFVPQGSGEISFSLEGRWAGAVKDPVLVSNIRVNGKLMKNGDFKQTFPHGGKTYPMNMWIMPPGLFRPKAGPNGMNAVSVTYGGGLRFGYPVKENRTYTFEVDVKRFSETAASAKPAKAADAAAPVTAVVQPSGKTQTIVIKPGKGYRITFEEL